jgi:hypothetical protein
MSLLLSAQAAFRQASKPFCWGRDLYVTVTTQLLHLVDMPVMLVSNRCVLERGVSRRPSALQNGHG